jgi:AAA domain
VQVLSGKAVGVNTIPLEDYRPFREPRIKLVPFDKITLSTDRHYLVKGLIPYPGLTVIWGPPKCGKSFWTLDVVMSVVLGTSYRGRRVQQGPVVYCAFEGQSGVRQRIEAYRQRHIAEDAEDIPFFLQSVTLDLIKEHSELIEAIKANGVTPVAVVLDTLNRSLNGSESSDEDMGSYVRAADAIRETFNCSVLVVHHCGVNDTRPRGHTSLTGAADAQLSVKRDYAGNIVTSVEFMKDGEAGAEIISKLDFFEIGLDEDGDPITCGVVVEAEAPAKAVREAKLKPNELTSFNILQGTGGNLSTEEWNDRAREAGLGLKRRADLHDIRESLKRKGLVYEGLNGWSVISK